MKIQDFEGLAVNHISRGYGIIEKAYYEEQCDCYYLEVVFNEKESTFSFPNCFEKFLVLEDPDANNYVQKLISDKKEKLAKEKAEKERLKKEAEEQAKLDYEYYIKNKRKAEYIEKQRLYFKIKHEKEFPYSTFLAYQGRTWDWESKEQILCIHREYDRKVAFWDIISELKVKDIILHCKGQLLVAVSRVTKEAYESDEDSYGENVKSLRLNSDYIVLRNPIYLQQYRDDIQQYDEDNEPRLSPFNKHGKGNQGYIYPIDRDLAQAFIAEATRQNQDLLNVEYIRELLELYR